MIRTKTRALANWPNNAVSVLDFGAVGDGSTNDTAAIQAAFNAAVSVGVICIVPQGTFMVSSLEMPSGLYIQGAGTQVTIFKQIADSVGPVLKSSYGSNIKIITLHDFYVDGNRADFTDPTIYNDGIYFEGGNAADNASCVARAVHVERATGNGWHFGSNRHQISLQYCYAKNCGNKIVGSDPLANSTGYGLRINSCADAFVGAGCGFGSNQNTSITIATSATPVIDSAEIWWAGTDTVDKPNIEFFKCPNFSCTNNNIDRSRVAAVKVTGRFTTSDQPYHENGFITGNTFLFPYGSGGAGVDGDVDFIQLKDTSGILISGNQFRANANDSGTDSRVVLVNYIVKKIPSSTVLDIAFTGNHWSTRTGGKPFVTAICNDYSIFSRLEASGTFTPQIKDNSSTVATTSNSSGAWFADGNTVTYKIALENITTTGLTLSDETRIYGLLAPNPLGTAFQTTGTVQFQQINVGTPAMGYVASVEGGDNYISIRGIVDNVNRSRIPLSELNSGTADIWLSISLPLHAPNGS